jgi:hypothetical protein
MGSESERLLIQVCFDSRPTSRYSDHFRSEADATVAGGSDVTVNGGPEVMRNPRLRIETGLKLGAGNFIYFYLKH